MNAITDQGFVLKTVSYGDSDLIVSLLTKENGMVKAFVRGAKNSKKRFGGGVLQPPHLIDFLASSKKSIDTESLTHLREASLLKDFAVLRSQYLSLNVLSMMIKICMTGEDLQKEHFNLFGHGLVSLSQTKNYRRFFSHFVARYLVLEGVLPSEPILSKLIALPMKEHAQLGDETVQTVNHEAAMASHYLHSYISSRVEIKWPK